MAAGCSASTFFPKPRGKPWEAAHFGVSALRPKRWTRSPQQPPGTSSSWLSLTPAVSRSCVSPLPYRPLDLRWRLFQRNSRTLIRNRPGLMDGRKLAPASRSEGVILNYSDLLGGEQVRGGFRGLPPSKTCGHVPKQSKTDASRAIYPHFCLCLATWDGWPGLWHEEFIGSWSNKFAVWDLSRPLPPFLPSWGWAMKWAGPKRLCLSWAGKLSPASCILEEPALLGAHD